MQRFTTGTRWLQSHLTGVNADTRHQAVSSRPWILHGPFPGPKVSIKAILSGRVQ